MGAGMPPDWCLHGLLLAFMSLTALAVLAKRRGWGE